MNILEAKKVHLVGIKGVALASLALCLSDAGIVLTGSDVAEEFVTEEILKKRGFQIYTDFSKEHITTDIDLVVFTGAHQGSQNVEVVRASELKIPTMSHAEALGNLTANKKLISICGAGGKSTTSAMCAWVLDQSGLKPSFAVGVGNIPNFGFPGRFVADSSWFVAEADEYAVDPLVDKRPRFIFQKPQVIICTNLKFDHPDIYPSFEKTKEVFLQFFNTLPDTGVLIVNGDDKDLLSLLPSLTTKAKVVTVGTSQEADFFLHDFVFESGKTAAQVTYEVHDTKEKVTKELVLQIPGKFNLMNAVMAWYAAVVSGASDENSIKALGKFLGTMRRFEKKGELHGTQWFDDYAHTPEEIQATLAALRTWCPSKKIIVIFQPHTYSRTKSLFDGFSRSFTEADEVLLLDIFASARENEDSSISSDMLVTKIMELEKNKLVKNMKTIEETAQKVSQQLGKDVVVMTLGAGDVYRLYDEVKKII